MKNTLLKDTFANDQLPAHYLMPDIMMDHQDFEYPNKMNCCSYLIDRWIDEGIEDRIALNSYTKDGKRISLTYKQVYMQVNQLANYLTNGLGLVSGNRVLIHSLNNIPMAIAWLACVKAGLIVVAAMPMMKAFELKKVIDKSEIKVALVDSEIAGEALKCLDFNDKDCYTSSLKFIDFFNSDSPQSLENKIKNESTDFKAIELYSHDICVIAFTSGTTGMPKGCIHFHHDILTMSKCVGGYVLETKPDDVFCGTPPLAFTFGLGGLLAFPLFHGAQSVLIEKPSPEVLLKAIEDFKVTTIFTSPTFYKRLANYSEGFDLSSVKAAVSAGEKLPAATHQLWLEKTGINLIDGIGSTEMIHIFISNTKKDIKIGSIGKPVQGYKAAVFSDKLKKLKPLEIGRLAVKGPTGCKYLADERQTSYVQNGWNLTGDLVYYDNDGYFYYQGRDDDMIISSGYNISGVDVEDALLTHPIVEECAVVGVPDSERGNIVKAFIVLKNANKKPDELVKELQNYVKSKIAPYKYPRSVEFVDELPKTQTGKIQRKKLRE